jgi:hypothetical protein
MIEAGAASPMGAQGARLSRRGMRYIVLILM